MPITDLQYVLWYAAPVLQLGILVLMWRRNLPAEFPFFFFYTGLQLIGFFVKFFVYHKAEDYYFWTFWTHTAISIFAGLAVIHEIFAHAFRPYRGLQDLGNILYRWVMMVMLVVSLLAIASDITGGSHMVATWLLALDRLMRLMQCGLLLFIALFASRLGFTWRHYIIGLTMGFGLFAATELALVTVRGHIGSGSDSMLAMLRSAAYVIAVFIWFAYLLSPEPARRGVPVRPQPDRWDFALLTLLNPDPKSFLGSVEQAVDRVLNGKTPAHT